MPLRSTKVWFLLLGFTWGCSDGGVWELLHGATGVAYAVAGGPAAPDSPHTPSDPGGSVLEALSTTERDVVIRALEEAQLEELLEAASAVQHLDRDDRLALEGAVNFLLPFPGGNGRACATCHVPRDGFSLSPASVEAQWQRLEQARRLDPLADDPLFRAIDADDGDRDFGLLRSRALIKVRVALPERVRLIDDPNASVVTVSRAVPPLDMLRHTAPYQQDRSVQTLEEQARNAVHAHMAPSVPPSQRFLDSVAEFERRLFSSVRARELSRILELGDNPPDLDPPLDALERRGKERFEELCARCHGGPAQVTNRENRIFPPFDGSTNPVSLNVVISNPPPTGFPGSVLQQPERDLPTQRFSVDLPDGSSSVLVSSDPGTVLTDARALETVAGNQVFNRFDIPQLRGIQRTAPYFHDHRAQTLEEVVTHYQAFFRFINQVRGLPLPLIADEDVAPLVAYMKRAL
jgi:hypothetical protein